ncbi:hypothetical protein [Caulobacter sp. LARHSG274]
MPWAIILALSIHVLAAIFWAGTTFTLARTGGGLAGPLFRPQMGAAALAVLSGAYLWFGLHHEGAGGPAERVLEVAALCALLAAGLQAVIVGRALAALGKNPADDNPARARLALGHRLAAILLALTAIGMVTARYA